MNKFLTRQSPGIIIKTEIVGGGFSFHDEETYSIPDTDKSGNAWKLDVGAECNLLLQEADRIQAIRPNDTNIFVDALRSIVARVAEFEELETE